MNRHSRSLEEINTLRQNFYERIDRGDLTISDAVREMRAIFDMTQAEFFQYIVASASRPFGIWSLAGGRRKWSP
jgi:hypothetical protein